MTKAQHAQDARYWTLRALEALDRALSHARHCDTPAEFNSSAHKAQIELARSVAQLDTATK